MQKSYAFITKAGMSGYNFVRGIDTVFKLGCPKFHYGNCSRGCAEKISTTDAFLASMFLILSIEVFVTFMVFTDADNVSLVMGGVNRFDEFIDLVCPKKMWIQRRR